MTSRDVTLTEGHAYLDLPGYISVMYPQIGEDFRADVTQGGMLALPRAAFRPLTQQSTR
ncbi:MAG TPA: hypothetical protein VFX59_29425 [Polyangiales bacterium]|nr:hypothetical protein [Polyangiales bacterium]